MEKPIIKTKLLKRNIDIQKKESSFLPSSLVLRYGHDTDSRDCQQIERSWTYNGAGTQSIRLEVVANHPVTIIFQFKKKSVSLKVLTEMTVLVKNNY